MGEDAGPQHEVPYLHVRAPRRVVGVGGEPEAKIHGNRAGLLALRGQLNCVLAADEGLTSQAAHTSRPTSGASTSSSRGRTGVRRWGSPASRSGPTAPCSPKTRPYLPCAVSP